MPSQILSCLISYPQSLEEVSIKYNLELHVPGLSLKENNFRFDTRKKFFTVRVVRQWNSLPRGVVDIPSLEVFKVQLDRALSNLIL